MAESAEPQIVFSFPASSATSALAQSALPFCFPEESCFRSSKLISGEHDTFTFTLTQSDGSRTIGYCRRFLINGQPECYCVLSDISSMSLFSKMLDLMEDVRRKGEKPSSISRLLMAIGEAERPPPGGSVIVRVPSQNRRQRTTTTHKLLREAGNQNLLDYVSMQALFQALSVPLVIGLVESLLVESRILFCSSDLGQLSKCVNAAVALLHPFRWRHIFIPVLPKHLLDYCCAPMPFVIGVLDAFLPDILRLPMDDVVIVHLDRHELLRPKSPDLLRSILPAGHRSRLEETVTELLGDGVGPDTYCRTSDLLLSGAFTQVYCALVSAYQEFFDPNDPARFMEEQFIAAQRPEVQQFLSVLQEAQLWACFVEERANMNSRGVLDDCPLVSGDESSLTCHRCGTPLMGQVFIKRGKGVCFKCYNRKRTIGKFLSLRKTHAHKAVSLGGSKTPPPSREQLDAPKEDADIQLRGPVSELKKRKKKKASRHQSKDDMCLDLRAGSQSPPCDKRNLARTWNAEDERAPADASLQTTKDDMCLPSASCDIFVSEVTDEDTRSTRKERADLLADAFLPPSLTKTDSSPAMPLSRWVPSAHRKTSMLTAVDREAARKSFLSIRSRDFLSEIRERQLKEAMSEEKPQKAGDRKATLGSSTGSDGSHSPRRCPRTASRAPAPIRPMCAACGGRLNKKETDVSIYANSVFWHPTCLRCQLCSCSILPPYLISILNELPVHKECVVSTRKSLTQPLEQPLSSEVLGSDASLRQATKP